MRQAVLLAIAAVVVAAASVSALQPVPGSADVLARGFNARTGKSAGTVFAMDYESGRGFTPPGGSVEFAVPADVRRRRRGSDVSRETDRERERGRERKGTQ